MTATAEKIDLREVILQIPGYDPNESAGDCWFDEAAAAEGIDFFHEVITHVKGSIAGMPFILEPWQQAIIANIFGWKRPDGMRRYSEVFIYVPRKNGKTAMSSGIVLLVMFTDHEPGAEIYSTAGEKDQATLIFKQCKGMIENEVELDSRCQIYKATKSIVFDAENTSYKALSADADTKHGFNSHLVINDELHVQPNRDLIDVMETSMGSRDQPLTIHITTADFNRPSICNEKLEYAEKVRDGVIDDSSFLPVIYAADIDDDWTDEEVWKKANPNLGISLKWDYMRRKCKKAVEKPSFENTFKRLHLNIKTEQDVRWLTLAAWDACAGTVDPIVWRKMMMKKLLGRRCFGGIDLSSTRDITSLKLIFPDDEVGYYLLSWFWIPKENASAREKNDRVPYLTWAKQGFIEMTEGNVIDYDAIRLKISGAQNVFHDNPAKLAEWKAKGRSVEGLIDRFDIVDMAIDRWASAQITNQLTGDGVEMIAFGQGFASMSAPTKELEKITLARQLQHGANPVLRWMASNVAVETDAAGNLKPSKKKSTEKIDGIVSTIMSLGRATADVGEKKSVYEDRGMLEL